MYEKIVLVTRRTRLDALLARYSTVSQAEFIIKTAGGDFSDYEEEDIEYKEAYQEIRRGLPADLKLQVLNRDFLPTYLFGPRDLVVTLGQDGLVANTAKYVKGQPIVAINPDPERFDGVLMPFRVVDAAHVIERARAGRFKAQAVTFAEARTNDGQVMLGFNDLFIGVASHISARYRLRFGRKTEIQSSSGIIVSTGAGASGWLSSIFNMVRGVSGKAGARAGQAERWDWSEERLRFVVREPFASKTSAATLVSGEITPGKPLEIESRMPEQGIIFSDGIESDALEFNSGATAFVGVAKEKGNLVVEV